MNYLKHYDALIMRAQSRIIDGYVEKHHIIPRCMGGTDDVRNIVSLTPEEHFVAHQLLVKMNPSNPKLVFALIIMTGDKKNTPRNNKVYGWIKKRLSESKTGRKYSEESKKKMSASALNRKPMSAETKQKMSTTRTGKSRGHMSAEHKKKISETKQQNPKPSPTKGQPMSAATKEKLRQFNLGKHHSDETKKKISQNHSDTSWNKGLPLTEEHRNKLSIAAKGKSKPTTMCPHCKKEGSGGSMHRWHFDNCKSIRID